ITRNEVGAIRIGQHETHFQVPSAVARKFADAVKRTAGVEGADESGITIEQSEAPREQARERRKGPPPKPHRGQGGPGGKGGNGPRVFHKGKPKGSRG
ncbi:MAG: DEAD/DEAH box helicase, partial [Novosphingobium sp.]